MHRSLATISAPEFINLQPMDLNPLMSSCEIKVLYVGQNRNRTFISKEVATEMAKTLRGAPIVGYFKKEKEDFVEHSERITIDEDGFHIDCLTKPYGFVAPDSKVWFKDFEDFDEFGNSVVRTYLMVNGYLWTGQFEECADVVKSGRPHSMELDPNSLQGEWTEDYKSHMEFFIINDAIFSKLCILGNDIEPCFEGSSVTKPDVSVNFSNDSNKFVSTLFTMMQELKFALEGRKEPMDMENTQNTTPVAAPETDFSNQDKTEQINTSENQNSTEDYAKKDEEKKEEPKTNEEEKGSDDSKSNDDSKTSDEEDDKKKKKYSAEEYEALQAQYSELEAKYNKLADDVAGLTAFKAKIDSDEKDALIAEFYMLSDEDKADVIANKDKYSLDEIEAKLSVICRRKKVNFASEVQVENNTTTAPEPEAASTPITTFSLNSSAASVPGWVAAVKNNRTENTI